VAPLATATGVPPSWARVIDRTRGALAVAAIVTAAVRNGRVAVYAVTPR